MITIKNLTKVHHNKVTSITALSGISLEFSDAGLVFITGESGSGKTTLLDILSGNDRQTTGEMHVKGVSTKNFRNSDLDDYRSSFVGSVDQQPQFLEHMTLAENISLALEIQGKVSTETEIRTIFGKLGLSGLERRYPREVSGGQLQRAAIARVLIKRPKILFADELTSNLDPENRDEIYRILKMLSQKILVIATSHNRDIVKKHADRIINISRGQIVSDSGEQKKKKSKKNKNENPHVVGEAICRPISKSSEAQPSLNLEKTSLPLSRAITLAWHNICTSKFRVAYTLVLVVFAIAFFAVTMNLSTLTENRAIINSFLVSSQPYMVIGNPNNLLTPADRRAALTFSYPNMHTEHAPLYRVGDNYKATLDTTFGSGVSRIPQDIFAIRFLATFPPVFGDYNIFGERLLHGGWPQMEHNANQVTISDFMASQIHASTAPETDRDDFFEYLVADGRNISMNNGQYRFTIHGIYQTNYRDFVHFNSDGFLQLDPDLSAHAQTQALHLLRNNWVTAYTSVGVVSRIMETTSQIHTTGGMNQFFVGGANNAAVHSLAFTGDPEWQTFANTAFAEIIQRQGIIIRELPEGGGGAVQLSTRLATALSMDNVMPSTFGMRVTYRTTSTNSLVTLFPELNLQTQEIPSQALTSEPLFQIPTIGLSSTPLLVASDEHPYIMAVPRIHYADAARGTGLVNALVIPTQSVLVSGELSAGQLAGIIRRMDDRLGGGGVVQYMDSTSITEFFQTFSTTTTVMLILAIIFALFTVFLLYTLVTLGVRAKRTQLRLLRSLGAKPLDLFFIFLCEALMLTAAIVLGAFIFTFAGMSIANWAAGLSIGHALAIFTTGPTFYALLLTGVTVFLLTSFLVPSVKEIKKSKQKHNI